MRNPGRPFDVEVGRRLQAARYAAGLSQEELAACVGRTFQQVQKYERGDNRMALSTAARFCAVLEIELAEFIAGIDPTGA